MRNRNSWITAAILNLCFVALLGATLRTRFLFDINWIDYRNFLSAHSHFAFGGWVTLSLMVLLIDSMLNEYDRDKIIYQVILWGIFLSSWGMLVSFPFKGYAFFSIIFSTLFILFTYLFTWIFIKDLRNSLARKSVFLLVVSALASLVISSGGPFWLAYMMATKTGGAISYRDAVYGYLHFQYNGFFTLAVFALLIHTKLRVMDLFFQRIVYWFSMILSVSVLPGLFLSLLWHPHVPVIRNLAYLASVLNILACLLFFIFFSRLHRTVKWKSVFARNLLYMAFASFVIKILLQTAIVDPRVGNAIYWYRPVIIGFLHLIFLAFISFYIFSHFMENELLNSARKNLRFAVMFFVVAVIINELILLINGISLLMGIPNNVYGWLLWLASFLLVAGSVSIFMAKILGNNGKLVTGK